MNYLDKRVLVIDKVNIPILHNLQLDIIEYMKDTDLHSEDKNSIKIAIEENKATALICVNKDLPKYIMYIKVGNLVVTEINNIDTNSLLYYIKRYNISITKKIQLII